MSSRVSSNLTPSLHWRYETKFNLIVEDEMRFIHWMAGTPDFSRAHVTRHVNSVYLDSTDYACAVANLDGTGWRSKFRIRWYGRCRDPDRAVFEAKFKRGRLGTKQICPLTLNGVNPLLLPQSNLENILRDVTVSEQVLAPVENLKPVLYVGYEREYYQGAAGIRITLDRGLNFQDITDDHGTGNSEIHRDNRLILEFKFAPEQKDQVAELMSDLPFSATRNSKYILGLSRVGKAVYF